MILTKGFVNSCRSICVLRDFLCQAIDQVDAMEEERRWRKLSEEMPKCDGDYLVMARYPDDDEPHMEICFYDSNCEDFGHYERRYAGSGNCFGGFDGEEWITHNVSFWMPLPSAPKEADK